MNEIISIIICPHCGKEIPLDEVLTHRIRDNLKNELEAEARKKERELAHREVSLAAKEKELAAAKKTIDDQVARKLALEREQFRKEAEEKAKEATGVELKDLREQLTEKTNMLAAAQKLELDLRKGRRELEEKHRAFELEMTRRLDGEREKVRSEAIRQVTDEHRFKDLEKEKIIDDMRKQIEDLKRKAEQGSQQLQGEVLELKLEEMLRERFPHDTIEPVPKGLRGADVIQTVRTTAGQPCGTIIWESKRTKAWSNGWIEKLKEDQREAKADMAAIISTTLPDNLSGIGCTEGVWITDFSLVIGLALALRESMVRVAQVKRSMEGKGEKMEMLYEYLSGSEFRQQIEGIVEAFVSMKKDLDTERRSMEKIWAKREKQIEKVVRNTGRMYGSLQGIVGSTLPELKSLEMKALEEGE